MGTEVHKSDLRLPAIGNISGGVKSNSIPDDAGFRLWIAVSVQKSARGVGAVHFEALVASIFLGKAQVVEQRRDIHQLTVVVHLPLPANELCEPCPVHVIE